MELYYTTAKSPVHTAIPTESEIAVNHFYCPHLSRQLSVNMDMVFVEDTLKEYRDETDSRLDELNGPLSKLQQQQDSFELNCSQY